MNRCPLFVELCAGTVAVSLRLQGGNRCRPVVSRMGAKTGYANVILACFGLTPGGKADAYLWCEPDPGARLLLQALPQPEVLREAASVLREWASQDPRTLWEALRKEGAPKGVDGREVARYACLLGSNRLIPGTFATDGRWVNAARDGGSHTDGGVSFGGSDFATPTADLADGCDRLSTLPSLPPTTITDDARTVDPREVARYTISSAWTSGMGAAYCGPDRPSSCHPPGWVASITAQGVAERLDTLPSLPPTTITDDARALAPPLLPVGTVCLIDPPYVQTTGYGHELPRAEVVRLARLWADAGAFVGVCEQEPIPELVGEGWHAVDITHGRRGQKRTFSRQQREYLTLSRAPVNPPLLGEQVGLF